MIYKVKALEYIELREIIQDVIYENTNFSLY